MRIDVYLVGIYAHAQLLARRVGKGKETRLELHRQHEQRHVRLRERLGQLRRQRRRSEGEQIAGCRKQSYGHNYLGLRLIVGLVTRVTLGLVRGPAGGWVVGGWVVGKVGGVAAGAERISSDA